MAKRFDILGVEAFRKGIPEDGKIKDLTTKFSREVVATLSESLYDIIMESFRTPRDWWPRLSAITVAMKGHDKVLTDSGDFMRSIKRRVIGHIATVGVLTPIGPKGQDLELIAKVFSGGAVIRVTEKMRRFFAVKGMPLRRSTSIIRVPPRPVFEPAADDLDKEAKRVVGPMIDALGKELGFIA